MPLAQLPVRFSAVVFWSLAVEEKFYLLAPLLIGGLFRLRNRTARLCTVAALALVPIASRLATSLGRPRPIDYPTYFHALRSPFHVTFDGLVVGVLVALVYLERDRWRWCARRLSGVISVADVIFGAGASVVAVIASTGAQLDQVSTFDRIGLQALLAWSFGAVVLGAALGGGPQRLLSARQAFVMAKLAYTTYLVHMLVIPLSLGLVSAVNGTDRALVALMLFTPIYLSLALLVALALHLGVERPALERWNAARSRRPRLEPQPLLARSDSNSDSTATTSQPT